MSFPKTEDIEKILAGLNENDFSEVDLDMCSPVDRLKIELCRQFIVYLDTHQLDQKGLAALLEVDKSRVNWIVRYKIQNFTIDRLYSLYSKLDPSFRLKAS